MLDQNNNSESSPLSSRRKVADINQSVTDGTNQTEKESLLKTEQPTTHSAEITQEKSSSSKKGRKSKILTASFVEKNRYGYVGDDSEEDDPEIIEKTLGATPNTRRRIIKEENVKKQKKLGPMATAFTIFKGFVCTGILYMPADFVAGGYGFSAITVISALFLTLYCAKLLLEVYASVGGNGNSLPDIGYKVYGKPGKIAVDISLFASQFGFVAAYVYFIASQVGGPGGII